MFPLPRAERFHLDELRVYGQVEWAFAPAFELSLGLRAERHDASYEDSNGERYRTER